ncbi:MAG: NAD(P)/FAD-dependent oxidoreductase [Candidatus Pacearchaeota archaeon]|nr:NAD(P)/FAD-dependent oxidoreductase [Candidatus Pacearchaeota archaeon]
MSYPLSKYFNKKFRLERELRNEKIEVINNTLVKEIRGEDKVASMLIQDKSGEKEINVDGIFIEEKTSPLMDFAKRLRLRADKNNFLVVDRNMETSVKGIFAAGDVTDSKIKGVLTASAQGEIAVKSAGEFLR